MGKKRKKKKHKPEKKEKSIEKKHVFTLKMNNRMKRFTLFLPSIVMLALVIIYFAPFLSSSKMMGGSDWMLGEYAKRV